MPFLLHSMIMPKGIIPPRKVKIGIFKTISDVNYAARGFASGCNDMSLGIRIHPRSIHYYTGRHRASSYKGCKYYFIYELI